MKPLKQRFFLLSYFRIFGVLISMLIFLTPLQGEEKNGDISETPLSVIKQDGTHFLDNAGAVAMAPFRWQQPDFLRIGLYSGITMLSMPLDKPVKDYFQDHKSGRADDFFMIDDYYGSGKMLLLSGAMYAGGFLFRSKKVRRMGLLSFEAFLFSGIAANLIKPVIGRMRPDVSQSNLKFNPFTLNDDNHAIPSGHTTVAFAFSTAMAKSIDHPLWDVFWYGLATSTALARIYHNRHWASDVVSASLLGYSVGAFLVNREEDFEKKDSAYKFYLIPNGIGLVYHFN